MRRRFHGRKRCAGPRKRVPEVHTLLGDPFERQDLVTHIWGAKVYARNDPEQNRILCNFLLQCILRHFPDFSFGTPKLQSLLETYK